MGVLRTISTGSPPSFVGNINGFIYGVNGIDRPFVRDPKNGMRNWGIDAPPSTDFAVASTGGGVVDGVVQYRVTWENQNASIYGMYGNTLTFTASTDTVGITRPSITGIDSQVTHWVWWRTKAGESTIFYRGASTAIGTNTASDNTADDALSSEILNEHFPLDGMFRYIKEYKGLIFAYGSKIESTGTVTVANGSANVQGNGTQFSPEHANQKLYFTGDATTFTILTWAAATGAAAITISPVKVGAVTGGTYKIMADDPSAMTVQNADDESFQAANRWKVFPNDGDFPSGMDIIGATLCLYKQHHVYGYEFGADPSPAASAVVYPILAGRGLVNEWCSVKDGPTAFNLDRQGIYQFDGAGQAEAIDLAIRRFFRPDSGIAAEDRINWNYTDTWRAILDPVTRTAVWFVTTGSDAVPQTALVYDIDRQHWTVHRFPQAVRAACLDSDSTGVFRAWLMSGSAAPASPWAWGGTRQLDGTVVGTIAGTATASGNTTLTDGTAAFTTAGDGLKDIPLVALTNPYQIRMIASNTGTVLTISAAWTVNPPVGTKYRVGAVETRHRGVWYTFDPQARAQTQTLTVYFEPTAADTLFWVRIFKDFSATPILAWQATVETSGVRIPYTARTDGWLEIHANEEGGRVVINMPQNAIRAFSVEVLQLDANNPVIVNNFDLEITPLGKSNRAE